MRIHSSLPSRNKRSDKLLLFFSPSASVGGDRSQRRRKRRPVTVERFLLCGNQKPHSTERRRQNGIVYHRVSRTQYS